MSSVTTTESPTATRMRSEDRRELILEAATAVFGERGYVGATTDAVARAARVSQPYVVRMFGTKEALFLEVLRRGLDKLLAAFRGALHDTTPLPEGIVDHAGSRIGRAYADLLSDRGLEGADHQVDGALDDGDEQRLLGAEHPHHVGLAHPGGLGHRVGRGALVTALAEDSGGDGEHLLPPVFAAHPGLGL